jgi:predicted alternative tryptophan synthase beta-subunit
MFDFPVIETFVLHSGSGAYIEDSSGSKLPRVVRDIGAAMWDIAHITYAQSIVLNTTVHMMKVCFRSRTLGRQ